MDDKFELVKKYNIDVDVYIDRDGTTPVGKLSDRNLTKEFLRLYFMGHIAKVWKVWLTDIYMAQTTDGKEIFLPETNISSNPQLSSSASFLRLNVLSSLN